MDFARQIGTEAYISVNLGSGTAKEAAEWLEYMTADRRRAWGRARQKRSSGAVQGRHPRPRQRNLGLRRRHGAAEYVNEMKRFSHFVHNLTMLPADEARGRGPGRRQEADYTEAVMKAWKDNSWAWGIEGLSLHSYATGGWPPIWPGTGFDEKDYAGRW